MSNKSMQKETFMNFIGPTGRKLQWEIADSCDMMVIWLTAD